MPRYFFDSNDGRLAINDVEGMDFPDLEAAKEAAAEGIGALSKGMIPVDGKRQEIWILVRDEHGRNLARASLVYELSDLPLN